MNNLITNSEYIEINNDQLELIKMKGLRNRIKNECNILYKEYHNVLISVDETKNIVIKAVEFINNNARTYKFILTIQYPFYPPKMLKKIKGQDCLCCHSLNCSANWSPAIKLYHIIGEINNTLKFKRDIINLLLADKIKIKNNIPYAYIEEYLIIISSICI